MKEKNNIDGLKAFTSTHFLPICLFGQVILILLFGLFTQYDPVMDPINQTNETAGGMVPHYAPYQDVHVMMFVGFGFLYVYLGKYAYLSVSVNFLLGAFVIQWAILNLGFWDTVYFGSWHENIKINIEMMINADYTVAAVLISLGAVLGKFSVAEYIIMAFFEVIFYAINFFIGYRLYGAVDIGGSMFIHVFGAYFGLTLSWCYSNSASFAKDHNHSLYNSNIFSILGTIFLWMFWPSFNCALAVGGQQHRTVINTVLSLCASCVVSFCISAILRRGKFDMVEIQNATLAGGVAVGATADLIIHPFGAIILGSVAGTISTLGFAKLTPFLERTLGLHDTAGIHNLHAMPGVLGGLAGIFSSLLADATFGDFASVEYPYRANTTIGSHMGLAISRDQNRQAGYQAAALFTSIGIGVTGALITALFLKIPYICRIHGHEYFLDTTYFHELPTDHPSLKKISSEEDQDDNDNDDDDDNENDNENNQNNDNNYNNDGDDDENDIIYDDTTMDPDHH